MKVNLKRRNVIIDIKNNNNADFLQKILKCALIVNFVIVNINAASSTKPDFKLDNVKVSLTHIT